MGGVKFFMIERICGPHCGRGMPRWWFVAVIVTVGLLVGAAALAYERTPTGSDISPPITTTLELSDFGDGCAGADSWQNWYQRDDYSEIIGSASEARYSLPYTYEWTPEDATGTAAWIRADCMGPGGSTSSYTNDAFSWAPASTSTTPTSTATFEPINDSFQFAVLYGMCMMIFLQAILVYSSIWKS